VPSWPFAEHDIFLVIWSVCLPSAIPLSEPPIKVRVVSLDNIGRLLLRFVLDSQTLFADFPHWLYDKRTRLQNEALKRKGFRIMLLLRLCPVIPFNGLNYVLGVTGVSADDFLLSLTIGSLPLMLLTVVMGATAERVYNLRYHETNYYSNPGTISNSAEKLAYTILLFSGLAFAVIAVVYTWKKAKKELQKVRARKRRSMVKKLDS
jgi:membrane protein DedA with SNARE-associated domain